MPVAPEHRARLEELREEPGILRWWQEPDEGWLDEEPGVFKRTVLLDDAVIGYLQWHEESDPMYRRALAKADRNEGRRGPWLRLLDRLGMGFDS